MHNGKLEGSIPVERLLLVLALALGVLGAASAYILKPYPNLVVGANVLLGIAVAEWFLVSFFPAREIVDLCKIENDPGALLMSILITWISLYFIPIIIFICIWPPA